MVGNGKPVRMEGERVFVPQLERRVDEDGQVVFTLGDPLVDDYLGFVAARARWNTLLAVTVSGVTG